MWLKQGHKLTTEMTGNGQRLSHLLLDVGPKTGDPKRAQLGPLHSTRKKSRAFTAKRQGMKGILWFSIISYTWKKIMNAWIVDYNTLYIISYSWKTMNAWLFWFPLMCFESSVVVLEREKESERQRERETETQTETEREKAVTRCSSNHCEYSSHGNVSSYWVHFFVQEVFFWQKTDFRRKYQR